MKYNDVKHNNLLNLFLIFVIAVLVLTRCSEPEESIDMLTMIDSLSIYSLTELDAYQGMCTSECDYLLIRVYNNQLEIRELIERANYED